MAGKGIETRYGPFFGGMADIFRHFMGVGDLPLQMVFPVLFCARGQWSVVAISPIGENIETISLS